MSSGACINSLSWHYLHDDRNHYMSSCLAIGLEALLQWGLLVKQATVVQSSAWLACRSTGLMESEMAIFMWATTLVTPSISIHATTKMGPFTNRPTRGRHISTVLGETLSPLFFFFLLFIAFFSPSDDSYPGYIRFQRTVSFDSDFKSYIKWDSTLHQLFGSLSQ